METLGREKIITTVYDNAGEAYGVIVNFDWELTHDSIYLISDIKWQYIDRTVKPEADGAMDDVKDGILAHFDKGPIDFDS